MLTFEKKPLKNLDVSTAKCVRLRQFCIKLTERRSFEVFILVAILIDTIQLAYFYFMITPEETHFLMIVERGFFALFCLEALLKIIARSKEYFKDRWN